MSLTKQGQKTRDVQDPWRIDERNKNSDLFFLPRALGVVDQLSVGVQWDRSPKGK